MAQSSPEAAAPGRPVGDLTQRLADLGRTLGRREASHRGDLDQARACLERLHAQVAAALEVFHRAASEAGAPHLHIAQSEIRLDDKHVRALEFDLCRGRHKAIVTARSRGEVTLVGPFRTGKTEGPCLTFPLESEQEIGEALLAFLTRFVEEASTP